MHKQLLAPLGLITLCLLGTYPLGTVAIAQSPPASQTAQPSIWNSILKILTDPPLPRRRGGGRPIGSGLEMLSPGIWSNQRSSSGLRPNPVKIWHTQPMLIWQIEGNQAALPNRIQVVEAGKTTPIWQKEVQPDRFVTLPVGKPLEPGQTYQIQLLSQNQQQSRLTDSPILIQVLPETQRQLIAQQLNQAEAAAKLAQRSASPSEAAIAVTQKRLEVFVRNQLWSDALQELNSSKLAIDDRQRLTQAAIARWQGAKQSSETLHSGVRLPSE